jgi:hypothetical protein
MFVISLSAAVGQAMSEGGHHVWCFIIGEIEGPLWAASVYREILLLFQFGSSVGFVSATTLDK